MSAPVWTPGPWVAKNGNSVMRGGRRICAAGAGESLNMAEEIERSRHNAKLIAAAPDLYAALAALVARYEHDGIPNDSAATVDAARAALAKARGEA